MTKQPIQVTMLWARFRFSVIGPLLSAPPPGGELQAAFQALAEKVWTHPVSGENVRYSARTIETWYYKAKNARDDDPVRALQRNLRKDAGQVFLNSPLAQHLRAQYHDHPHWTYQLHYDNLASAAQNDPSLGPLCSYSTVKRYMQTNGMLRKRRQPKGRPGEVLARQRRENREVRSYESEYTGSLWHLDSITGHSRCSPEMAAGSDQSHWASWMTIRVCVVICSGICRKRPKTWCMGSHRRFKSVGFPAP